MFSIAFVALFFFICYLCHDSQHQIDWQRIDFNLSEKELPSPHSGMGKVIHVAPIPRSQGSGLESQTGIQRKENSDNLFVASQDTNKLGVTKPARSIAPKPSWKTSPTTILVSHQQADSQIDQSYSQYRSLADGHSVLFSEPAELPKDEMPSLLERIANEQLLSVEHTIHWTLDDVIGAALSCSLQVHSLRLEPLEQLQDVGIVFGEFDANTFLESRFINQDDNQVGIGNQVVNDNSQLSVGIAKQLSSGGQIELKNNFQFDGVLGEQSGFSAQISKELLRDAGTSIGLNKVLVAQHEADAIRANSYAKIADHLNTVSTVYWDIFAARGELIAARDSLEQGKKILRELESRKSIDAERNLIEQTRAAINERRLLVIKATNQLAATQYELGRLINSPQLCSYCNSIELIPLTTPDLTPVPIDIRTRMNTAMNCRLEIAEAIERVKSARATNHFSLNQLLPKLSLFLQGNVGEFAQTNVQVAANQSGVDSLEVGMNFEMPIGNRKARYSRRKAEIALQKIVVDWKRAVADVQADVLTSVQNLQVEQAQLEIQADIIHNSTRELFYLELRKREIPSRQSNPSFALTQLLAAQDRQVAANVAYISAIGKKQEALFDLNRATGILIRQQDLDCPPACPRQIYVYHQWREQAPRFTGQAHSIATTVRRNSRAGRNFPDNLIPSRSCDLTGNHQSNSLPPTVTNQ